MKCSLSSCCPPTLKEHRRMCGGRQCQSAGKYKMTRRRGGGLRRVSGRLKRGLKLKGGGTTSASTRRHTVTDQKKKHLDAIAAQQDLAMACTKKSNQPLMIDSRFMEKDLNNVSTFEFEKPKFGLLGKAKKKSAKCKVEKEVNGELKPCSFKTSAMKSFKLW
ncbi:unnamed protein product [Natator depressus]